MAQLLHIDRLTKLTLTRKGRAVAKHPQLRSGVVEMVKAHALEEGQENPDGTKEEEEGTVTSWYKDFEDWLEGASFIPDDCWEKSFQDAQESSTSTAVEKAAKKKNYPNSQGPFAGPHNSFPIRNQSDVYDAARLVGHAQNPAAVKAAIIRIAHSKGYSLPKSWQTKASKSMERLSLKELAERLAELASEEQPAEEGGTEVEKARPGRKSMHSHDHAHQSRIGYGYSHDHDHGHDSDGMANHEKSETAHAHEHVSKAEDVTNEEILANQAGLQKDFLALKALVEGVIEKLDTKDTSVEEAVKAIDARREEAEKVIAEKAEAIKALEVEAARKPMTLGAGRGASQRITRDMKFDDALHLALHGSDE